MVKEFSSDREALDYMAGRIAAEAEREGVPLSEVERKMLYCSETDWTLPDMDEVSAEFDRDYDEYQYERKIVWLINKIEAHDDVHHPEEMEAWEQAVIKLSEGDRYLLVLLKLGHPGVEGFLPAITVSSERPSHDRLMLWLAALAIVIGSLVFSTLGNWVFGAKFWAVTGRIFGNRDTFDVIVLCALLVGFFVYKLKRRLNARRTGIGLPRSSRQ